MFNILNGGKHALDSTDFQEFMIVPHKKTIVENLVVCNAVFNKLKEILEKNYGELDFRFRGNDINAMLGDEGGFAPNFKDNIEPIRMLRAIVKKLKLTKKVNFGMDAAATDIADFAYGVGADGFKLGAPARGERVAKYNRLLEIEEGK